MSDTKTINVKLSQPNHNGTGPFYQGSAKYFGFSFVQIGEELIAVNVDEDDVASLLDAKKVKKVSAAVLKELKAEEKEA